MKVSDRSAALRLLVPLAFIAALGCASCDRAAGSNCSSNADCAAGEICDTPTRLCVADPGLPPSLQDAALPDGFVGSAYEHVIPVSDGSPPLTWALVNLPDTIQWLKLDPATGSLSGTPLAPVTAVTFQVTVTDNLSRSATATYTLTILKCHDGDKQSCTAETSGACFLGEQICANGAFGTCSGKAPSVDMQSCGPGCGSCAPTLADSCDAGACACGTAAACAGGDELCCSGTCRDTQNDPEACGGCGVACDTGRANVIRACDAGACEYPCAQGFARCPAGSSAAGCDTNLMSDVQNCGACGQACPTSLPNVLSMSCTKGACEIAQCDSGFADCNGLLADGCETNVQTDSAHCGGCGVACSAPANASAVACQAGTCAIATCASGFADCDQTFANGCEVNTTIDSANCGACGTTCAGKPNATGYACQSSSCTVTACAADFSDCNMQYGDGCETDLNSTTSCGACGNVCGGKTNATGYSCSNKTCAVAVCATGFADCDKAYANGCEINLASTSNCGSCGTVCGGKTNATGYACTSGACAVAACAAGFADCDGQYANGCETNNTTTSNCGACGNVCGGKSNASTYACTAGSCQVAICAPGFADCDGLYANGCETSTTTLTNCGACGNACSGRANASAYACTAGACTVTACNAGFGNCDGTYANGCETNLNTSTSNCGTCGTVCGSKANATGYSCTAGACGVTSCSAGFSNCNGQYADGCEVNTTNNVNNCGACGNVCGGRAFANSYACTSSACSISTCQAGHLNCDGVYSNGCEVAASFCP